MAPGVSGRLPVNGTGGVPSGAGDGGGEAGASPPSRASLASMRERAAWLLAALCRRSSKRSSSDRPSPSSSPPGDSGSSGLGATTKGVRRDSVRARSASCWLLVMSETVRPSLAPIAIIARQRFASVSGSLSFGSFSIRTSASSARTPSASSLGAICTIPCSGACTRCVPGRSHLGRRAPRTATAPPSWPGPPSRWALAPPLPVAHLSEPLALAPWPTAPGSGPRPPVAPSARSPTPSAPCSPSIRQASRLECASQV